MPAPSDLRSSLQTEFDPVAALNLLNHGGAATEIVARAKAHFLNQWWWNGTDYLEIWVNNLLERSVVADLLNDHEILDALHRQAFCQEGASWNSGIKARAIRCLAVVNPEWAFHATKAAFLNPKSRDRELYPSLLMKIDSGKGLPCLLLVLETEKSQLVTRAILAALPRSIETEALHEELTSLDWQKRANACFVAGHSGCLNSIIGELDARLDDEHIEVADEALRASMQVRKRETATVLMNNIASTNDETTRWNIVEMTLDITDPGQESDSWPEWFHDAAQSFPAAMFPRLRDMLHTRRKERKSGDESADWFNRA